MRKAHEDAPGKTRAGMCRVVLMLLFLFWHAEMTYAGPKVTCTNESASVRTCRIDQPEVAQSWTPYPSIVFRQGDRISFNAGGCVQTGGIGKTWKRYVNPSGPNSDRLYSGMVQISGVTPEVRISDVLGKQLRLPISANGPDSVQLVLGYRDDDYGDNGYNAHDDGTEHQCKNIGPAWVTIRIQSDPWLDWTEIPGQGQFLAPPSAAEISRVTHVFAPDQSAQIRLNTFDGRVWSGWQPMPIPGWTRQPIATRFAFVGLFVAHTGLDGNVYYAFKTAPESAWTSWFQVPGGMTTSLGVSVASSNAGILLFLRSSDNKVYVNQSLTWEGPTGPLKWRGWQVVDGAPASATAVSADGALDGRVVAIDANGQLSQRGWTVGPTSEDLSWSPWGVLSSPYMRGLIRGMRGVPNPPLAPSATMQNVVVNLGLAQRLLSDASNQWSPVPKITSSSSVNAYSRIAQPKVPGFSDLYLFGLKSDGRAMYTAMAPIVPFPPPPPPPSVTFKSMTLPNRGDYVNEGQPSTIRWEFDKSATCGDVRGQMTSTNFQSPTIALFDRAAMTSPGEFVVHTVYVNGTSLTTYELTLSCANGGAPAKKSVNVQLSPKRADPTPSIVYYGPFISPAIPKQKSPFSVACNFQNVGGAKSAKFDTTLKIDDKAIKDEKSIPELAPGASAPAEWNVATSEIELDGSIHKAEVFANGSSTCFTNFTAEP
ncbi:hypothetical protein [Variovorax sp. dw_308]|uniref:hypothetical protein n=1 Tax=Variovorax sp. dw_308 TaxID=2721546 RepID=UPI001C484A83|nr:hypothetical protein [Variovorax sp. dw_308]